MLIIWFFGIRNPVNGCQEPRKPWTCSWKFNGVVWGHTQGKRLTDQCNGKVGGNTCANVQRRRLWVSKIIRKGNLHVSGYLDQKLFHRKV